MEGLLSLLSAWIACSALWWVSRFYKKESENCSPLVLSSSSRNSRTLQKLSQGGPALMPQYPKDPAGTGKGKKREGLHPRLGDLR